MKNSKKNKLLLVGGEGYIGLVIKKSLIKKNYDVYTYDNLIYSNEFKSKKNNFTFGDIRNLKKLSDLIKNFKTIVILAGLVGDPITKKYPKISKEINEKAITNLIKLSVKIKVKKLIFVSTCSNYGIIPNNKMADESFKLKPLSLYAKSKVKIEKMLLGLKSKELNYTILRFATAFGVSPRMRFDLTINEFVKDIYYGKKLRVYDADTWRPYCHVLDFASIINKVLVNPKKTSGQVFNVGSDKNNYSKEMIVQKLKKYFPDLKIHYEKNNFDRRNYKVNFKKIKKIINIQPRYSVDYGIREIINFLQKKPINFYDKKNYYGNYKILKKKMKYDKSS